MDLAAVEMVFSWLAKASIVGGLVALYIRMKGASRARASGCSKTRSGRMSGGGRTSSATSPS